MNFQPEILPFTLNTTLALVVLILPLFSFVISNLLIRKEDSVVAVVSTLALAICFLIASFLFSQVWGETTEHSRVEWFELSPDLRFTGGVLLNNLSVLMLALVTLISCLVHLFSIAYMKGDPGYNRYFSQLGLFTFSMLGIVLSDNLLLIFMFWELVGFSSYLLIGFWFQKDSASRASQKAFIVNRIGDLGFLVGLMICWWRFQTLDLATLYTVVGEGHLFHDPWLVVSGLCFLGGVMGKSAQFPLQVWLPDAMEGPTPVSALIHAATMVAAGVFLLARISPIMPVNALHVVALVGAVTAFMGAIAAIRQFDIKKILAYSTISQLGYMVMGMGVGATDAAIFHLITHAFFKACLFLAAGAIINSLHRVEKQNNVHFDVQDIRIMGGLRTKMPFTFWVFLLSSFALMGVPLFSGFLSKEAILTATLPWTTEYGLGVISVVPFLGFTTVFLTAFYVLRMLLLVFLGENRLVQALDTKSQLQINDAPAIMRFPLGILALGSLFIFFSTNPLDGTHAWIMAGVDGNFVEHNGLVSILSVALVLGGMGLAYLRFRPSSERAQRIHKEPDYTNALQKLSFKNWHLDSIYLVAFVKPFMWMGEFSAWIDSRIIDRIIDLFGIFNVVLGKTIGWFDKNIVDGLVNLTAIISGVVGVLTKKIQAGKIQTRIILTMLIALILISWAFGF